MIDETWIRVADKCGSVKEVTLKDVVCNASEYRRLAGEMDAQDIAILRCLIALVHTVITRRDISGCVSPVTDENEAMARWRSVWELRSFPNTVLTYLDKWHERFWLFHPERPFFQVPEAEKGTENTIGKLNGAVSESNHKGRLFSLLSREGKKQMSFSEAARWLLFINAFDDCAAKQDDKSDGIRSFTVSWLGKLGLVYAEGQNLFETVMLNMPMVSGREGNVWNADVPSWEPEKARSREREMIAIPEDLASLYTLQSRRLLLKRDNGHVTGYTVMGGDMFDERNALAEPMTLWKRNEDKKTQVVSFLPKRHERDRYVWRDFAALTAADDICVRPGVVNWCDILRRQKILSKDRLITFGFVSVRYDSQQSSSITDSFSDSVVFHADILTDAGRRWREEIQSQIQKIEKTAGHLSYFVYSLRRADGLDIKTDDSFEKRAKSAFYEMVNNRFREWLLELDPSRGYEERDAIIIAFEKDIRHFALTVGQELFSAVSSSAYVGRKVKIDKHTTRFYAAPKAFDVFESKIWKLYPNMKGDGEDSGR